MSAGTDIPASTVRYGLLPYGDNAAPVIGMLKGWFKEVGITVKPQPTGSKVQDDQVVGKLVNNEIDMINWDGTVIIQSMTKAPDLKMVGFTDTATIHILAAPSGGAKTVSELVSGGMPFDKAMSTAMHQLVGKRVALSDTGYHKQFDSTVFSLGGVNPSQMNLTSISDDKMVELAKAGRIDFAGPTGAAQVVTLLKLGWTDFVSVEDILKGLPPGDKRAVASLDHVGPALSQTFYEKNRETVLRAMSVNFRIIDAILKDPTGTLSAEVPYLKSVTGGDYNLTDVQLIYRKISKLVPFEEQTKFWTDKSSPEYYRNVYDPQIKLLQASKVLPSGNLDASQAFLGTEVYRTMQSLKNRYEELAPAAKKGNSALAVKAQSHADNRNYLDAVRFALAAKKS